MRENTSGLRSFRTLRFGLARALPVEAPGLRKEMILMSAESQLWSRVRERDRLNKKFGEWKRDGKKFGQWNRIRKKFDEFERALETFEESFDHSFNGCSGGARCRGACAIVSPGLVTRWAPGEARVGRIGEAFALRYPVAKARTNAKPHRKLSRGQIRRSHSVAPNEAERHRCLLGSRSAVALFSKICMSTADSCRC
jgi:hypothetical protein